MTDQEINEQVARKLGWKPVLHRKWASNQNALDLQIPNYSHSIAAAWEIVRSAKTADKHFELWSPAGEDHWVCRFYLDGKITAGAGADTAPMAICLAFLKLP